MTRNYRILSKHQIKDRSKYNFCPYCWQELRSQGVFEDKILKDPATLQTLWYTKLLVIEQNDNKEKTTYIEENYQCTRCKRKNITVDDFCAFYTKPYKVEEK